MNVDIYRIIAWKFSFHAAQLVKVVNTHWQSPPKITHIEICLWAYEELSWLNVYNRCSNINNLAVGLFFKTFAFDISCVYQAQWLSGRVLDSRPRGRQFEPQRRHWVVSLSKNINPSLVLVQPRKNCPFIPERLLMGHKE